MKHYTFLDLGIVNEPYFAELSEAANRVIESGRYIGGREVDCFEENIASACDAPMAIGTSNGLDALRLILLGYKELRMLKDGDEVIVPANSFIASALAVAHCGLKPVFAEPDYDLMVMTGRSMEPFVGDRTRAIMPVDLYGRVAWDDDMAKIVSRHNLLVIEDAAQAIGARSPVKGLFGSHKAGALGHAGAFSFYPTKNIGALGDAGAVITHDARLAETIRALANYGRSPKSDSYDYRGFNCRLDPIQAALLNVKLKYLQRENADRFARATAYNNTIHHPMVKTPLITAYVNDCVWHQYVIRCERRDDLRKWLVDNGVESAIHYSSPLHRSPCMAEYATHPLPVSERLANEVISLPIASGTSVKDASDIGRIINEFK